LQAVDGRSLFELGQLQKLLIRMSPSIGAFIARGMPLAEVWSDQPLDEETVSQIRNAFAIAAQRSPEQDLEFFLIEISDIAVKALSPGINDPTTAKHCIDRLLQLLLALGKRDTPTPLRTKEGRVHFVARSCTFEGAVQAAFSEVLHFGRDNPAIIAKLRETLQTLLTQLPAHRHPPLHDLLVAM